MPVPVQRDGDQKIQALRGNQVVDRPSQEQDPLSIRFADSHHADCGYGGADSVVSDGDGVLFGGGQQDRSPEEVDEGSHYTVFNCGRCRVRRHCLFDNQGTVVAMVQMVDDYSRYTFATAINRDIRC